MRKATGDRAAGNALAKTAPCRVRAARPSWYRARRLPASSALAAAEPAAGAAIR